MTAKKTGDIPSLFLKQAARKCRKIGIAIMRPIPETLRSLKRSERYADLVVVGAKD